MTNSVCGVGCKAHEKVHNPEAVEAITREIEVEIATAMQRVNSRRAACPAISYPENLPVSQKKQDLYNAIRDNQVVIVAGETGSGKTTQLPKICLELGVVSKDLLVIPSRAALLLVPWQIVLLMS